RSAPLARAFKATENDAVPDGSEERTSLPTRTGPAWPARASEAVVASRSTSRRPPAPAAEIATEPRTALPCWLERSLIASAALPASGEPTVGAAAPLGWV